MGFQPVRARKAIVLWGSNVHFHLGSLELEPRKLSFANKLSNNLFFQLFLPSASFVFLFDLKERSICFTKYRDFQTHKAAKNWQQRITNLLHLFFAWRALHLYIGCFLVKPWWINLWVVDIQIYYVASGYNCLIEKTSSMFHLTLFSHFSLYYIHTVIYYHLYCDIIFHVASYYFNAVKSW